MRLAVALCALMFSVSISAQTECEMHSSESASESIGANIEGISESKIRTRGIIRGFVVDPIDYPIPIGVIDLYKIEKKLTKKGSVFELTKNLRPWKSYKTDDNGQFCISDIPDGGYILRVGTNQFLFNRMYLKVKKRKGSSKKPLKIYLELGT